MSDNVTSIKALYSSTLEKIKLSDDELIQLKEEVDNLRKKDPIIDIYLKKLNLTDEEYLMSLGDIYYYILDKQICSSCKKANVESCPKKNKGVFKYLIYDEDFKILKLNSSFCSCYEKMSDAFNKNLIFTSLTNDEINRYNEEFKNKIFNKDEIYTAYIKNINSSIKNIKDEELNKGYIFFKLANDKALFSAAIKMSIYKLNLKTSFFDFKDEFFSKLNSKFDNERYNAINIYEEAIKSKVLYIDNFDCNPNYFLNFTEKYLIDLLKFRNSKSYLTFINFSIFTSVNSYLNYQKKFLDSFKIEELKSLLNSIGVTLTIKNK